MFKIYNRHLFRKVLEIIEWCNRTVSTVTAGCALPLNNDWICPQRSIKNVNQQHHKEIICIHTLQRPFPIKTQRESITRTARASKQNENSAKRATVQLRTGAPECALESCWRPFYADDLSTFLDAQRGSKTQKHAFNSHEKHTKGVRELCFHSVARFCLLNSRFLQRVRGENLRSAQTWRCLNNTN